MRKRFLCLLLGLLCLTALLPAHGRAADAADVRAIADGIVAWKKADNGATADGFLLNDAFLALAGTTPGDWYPIGLSRLGVEDRYDAYLAVLRDQVEERYRQPGALSAAKATEWHRIALAVLAAGGDPTSFGTDGDGQPIDLIADGTYNRGRQTSLGRQGINGWIWGLIALDSMRYELPDDAFYTREDILLEILCRQLADGGFALSGSAADPDITAMAVQALAPYYNTETVYTYKRKSTDSECARRIRDVVDEALDCLSRLQLPTGDFKSWGTENVESTDQVVVALCCLGIDPLTDERFIKDGNTLLDGILRYRMDDGGFVHARSYDPDNPTSLPDRSNSMAGEQTLYTMAALWRQSAGLRTLYDFRPEQSEALKARIAALESGKIVVFGGGTGNPIFSTDTASALRALEIGADAMFKATMVDGVYDKDPHKYADAVRYDTLTFTRVLDERLAVMDSTAATLCRDNGLPILVFDLGEPANIAKALQGEVVGTLVKE